MSPDEFARDCERLLAEFRAEHRSLDVVDRLVEEFYEMPDNVCGGHLHVVLDDSNWSDETIEWCRTQAEHGSGWYPRSGPAVALASLLLELTPIERMSLACMCPCCVDGCAEQFGLDAAMVRAERAVRGLP